MLTWTTTTDAEGWTKHTAEPYQITVSPSGHQVTLFAPGSTTVHASVSAAQRAARTHAHAAAATACARAGTRLPRGTVRVRF